MKNSKSRPAFLLGALLMFVIAVTRTFGQESAEVPPTKEDLAKNNKLFIELASKACEYEREYEKRAFFIFDEPRIAIRLALLRTLLRLAVR
jgi:hypothetical protein